MGRTGLGTEHKSPNQIGWCTWPIWVESVLTSVHVSREGGEKNPNLDNIRFDSLKDAWIELKSKLYY